MTSARTLGPPFARSTRIRALGALLWGASPLILCLLGMTVDLAFSDRVADWRLLPMCGSAGSFFAVVGVGATFGAMLGLHPSAAAVALMSVYAGCRTGSPGACWVRLTTSILMVTAMWAGMFTGCFLAMRLALFLRLPSASLLSWTMMALGMLIAHGTMQLCAPISRVKLR